MLVTGGAGVIARATAAAFAAGGATVVLAGRDEAALAAAADEVRARAGDAPVDRVDRVVADVTDAGQAAGMVEAAVARHGGLHVAVNAAGVFAPPARVADVAAEDWRTVVDVNLTGVFVAMKYEIAHLAAHGGGAIVNVASNIGAHGRRPGLAAYAAAKAGVSVLTWTAAREYAGDGLRINAVSPGATDTPMSFRPGESAADRDARVAAAVPAGRVADPREVAAAITWLASDEASFVIGHDLLTDGGLTA